MQAGTRAGSEAGAGAGAGAEAGAHDSIYGEYIRSRNGRQMMKNLIILIVLVIVIGSFVDLPKGHTGEHGLTDQIIEQSDAIGAVRNA
jgi:hypothetical protein